MAARRDPAAVQVRAFAKINLTLQVLGLRADGFHELRTTFQSLRLHDTLTFTSTADAFRISCDEEGCPVDDTNLVWRAAERLWNLSRRQGPLRGVHVRIAKRIPMQAGLGGGSSDAAATIRALTALWRLKPSAPQLQEVASSLGADVSFFLNGGTALGVDRGDRIVSSKDAPARWVTLVFPSFGIKTPDAYRWWDEANRGRTTRDRGSATATLRGSGNDLQPPVAKRYPEIARTVTALKRCGARQAAMSGSGSALFGLFDSRATAERAADVLAGRSGRVVVTRTLSRRAYRTLARATVLPKGG